MTTQRDRLHEYSKAVKDVHAAKMARERVNMNAAQEKADKLKVEIDRNRVK